MYNLSDSDQICSDDKLICYQTENSPVYYSRNSRLSSLNTSCDRQSFHDLDIFSNCDSLINYQIESTPICFSHHSPISPLSLDLSYEQQDLSSTFGECLNKLNVVSYQLNKGLSVNNLNKPECLKENKLNDKPCETTGYLSGDCSDEEKSSFNNDGFKDNDNDDFYVNTCISLGHSLIKDKERFLDKLSQENNHQSNSEINQIHNDLNQTNSVYNKEDILRPRNLYSTSRTVFKTKQNSVDYETTTISNFSKKFISRSMYKIDGKESGGFSSSIVNGPVVTRKSAPLPEVQVPSNKIENSKTKGFKKIMGFFKKTS